ncbi:MAG: hypothetical protein JWN70_2575, partial [Planctomycetaceae bacterium]|nr:hypothetical protein [Planctomycetaceae bacterium]
MSWWSHLSDRTDTRIGWLSLGILGVVAVVIGIIALVLTFKPWTFAVVPVGVGWSVIG